eukprot:m.14412 g.14412  ORF g.14412 m.14412 type:complete len:69 (+) comp4304_c0_seq1:140-346(+)
MFVYMFRISPFVFFFFPSYFSFFIHLIFYSRPFICSPISFNHGFSYKKVTTRVDGVDDVQGQDLYGIS